MIRAFEEEKARLKPAGLRPELRGLRRGDRRRSPAATAQCTPAVTTQIQGAEKPRGPHKIVPHKPQPQQVSGGHATRWPCGQRLRSGNFE